MTLVDISDDRLDDAWHDNAIADPRTRESFIDASQLVPNTDRNDAEANHLQGEPSGKRIGALSLRVAGEDATELKKKLTAKGSIASPAWSGVLCSPAWR